MDRDLFELMEAKTWTYLLECLQKYAGQNRHGYWTDGTEILCKTEAQAEHLANFLEDIGFDYVNTGYYDPVEDAKSGETDKYTGFYYVSVD